MVNLQQSIDIKTVLGLFKRKDYAIIIVVIILSLILALNTVNKNVKEISKLNQNFAQKVEELELLKGIKALDKKSKKISVALKQFNVTNLTNKITAVADRLGLSLRSIDPLDKKKDKRFTVSPLSINLEGSYHLLGGFISEIESFDEFIEIREIRINSIQEVYKEGAVGLDVAISLDCLYWS